MVDVNVEATAAIFAQWIGEFLVRFAEDAVLGILEGHAIVVALAGFSG
jgi:hypothetical protein